MPTNKRQYWWCGGRNGCGHVVGEISHKELQTGGKVKVLLVYETSLEEAPIDIPPDRGMIVTGFRIPCTICAKTFDWYPSIESLNKLLSHYKQDV